MASVIVRFSSCRFPVVIDCFDTLLLLFAAFFILPFYFFAESAVFTFS